MADEVRIGGGPGTAKLRNPVGVALLTLITLGIYGLYWWYQINREMVDLGKALNADGLGDNPTTSLVAMFPGAVLVLPPLFSLYNTCQRIKRGQELTTWNLPTLNGWIVLVLVILVPLSLVAWGYMQAELNKAWRGRVLALGNAGTQAATAQTPRQSAAPETQSP
jgi:hypothetical protein